MRAPRVHHAPRRCGGGVAAGGARAADGDAGDRGAQRASRPVATVHRIAAFRKGLSEVGYVEGQNVPLSIAGAEGQYDRLPGLATDLVRRSGEP